MKRWWLQVAVSILIAGLLLSLVPIDRVWQSLRAVNPWACWCSSMLVFVAGHAINAIKLRVLLGGEAVTRLQCVRAHHFAARDTRQPEIGGHAREVRAHTLQPGHRLSTKQHAQLDRVDIACPATNTSMLERRTPTGSPPVAIAILDRSAPG